MLRLFIITQLLFIINTKDHNEKSIISTSRDCYVMIHVPLLPPQTVFLHFGSLHPSIQLVVVFVFYLLWQ